jgi:hypothetical protein
MQGWTRERTRGGGEKREKSSRTAASARSPGRQPQGVADDESHGLKLTNHSLSPWIFEGFGTNITASCSTLYVGVPHYLPVPMTLVSDAITMQANRQ